MPESHADLPAGYPFRPEFETTPREAAARFHGTGSGGEAGRYVIVDVREDDEVRLQPLAGAVHIPLGQLETRWDDLEVEAGEAFGVVCAGGVRSLKATLFLQQMGLRGARSIAGGMGLWTVQVSKD